MIRFWYGSGSPFAWRVQLVLEEKGLAYEPILLSFQQGEHKTPEHLARHPHGKVPALADGDLMLYESTAIVEYLEERYPTPALMPDDAAARALVRIEEIEATVYFMGAFLGVAKQLFQTAPERRDETALAEARGAVSCELAGLERRAARRDGAFVMGEAMTRADLTWLPFVELGARGGVAVEASGMPWLHGWLERLRARPSYAKSYPPHWRKG